MPYKAIELAKPFKNARITQGFNGNFKLSNGQMAYKDKHNAIDFTPLTGVKVLGHPVRSMANGGVVTEVRENHTVVIRHRFKGEFYFIKYLHLLNLTVKVGDSVKMFDIIGNVGGDPNDNIPDGGITTAPHLHVAMYRGEITKNNVIDFELYLETDEYFEVKNLADWQEKAKKWSIINNIISENTWNKYKEEGKLEDLTYIAEALRKTYELLKMEFINQKQNEPNQ